MTEEGTSGEVVYADLDAVAVSEQIPTPIGWYQIFYGRVTIHAAKDLIGFDVSSHEANWVARVEGPSGEQWNFPGCKVNAVMRNMTTRSVAGTGYLVP